LAAQPNVEARPKKWLTPLILVLLKEESSYGCIMTWESFVNNRLPLLNVPDDILESLRSGRIAYTKARTIARLKDEKEREAVLREAIAQDLSLTVIRSRVRALLSKQSTPTPPDLPGRASALARKLRRRKGLRDEKKRERLETLLAEMESLLEG
jgi:ParB family chromosome partitioning protein